MDETHSNIDKIYAKLHNRIASLSGLDHCNELAHAGAYKDKHGQTNVITCFRCGYSFDDIRAIQSFAEDNDIDFLKSCWVMHAKSHPWCEFLLNLKGK